MDQAERGELGTHKNVFNPSLRFRLSRPDCLVHSSTVPPPSQIKTQCNSLSVATLMSMSVSNFDGSGFSNWGASPVLGYGYISWIMRCNPECRVATQTHTHTCTHMTRDIYNFLYIKQKYKMKLNESHPHIIPFPSCCSLSSLSACTSIGSSLIDFKKSDALSSLLHESSFIFWRIGRDTSCCSITNWNNCDLNTSKSIESLKHSTHTIVKHKFIA